MSSAICFILDQSEILSSGNGLKALMAAYSKQRHVEMHSDLYHAIHKNGT